MKYLIMVSCLFFSTGLFAQAEQIEKTDEKMVEKAPTNDEVFKQLILEVEALESSIKIKLEELQTLQGEARALLGVRILDLNKSSAIKMKSAASLLQEMKQQGAESKTYTKTLHKHLNRRNKQLYKMYAFMGKQIDKYAKEASSIEIVKRFVYEQKFNKARLIISDILFALQQVIEIKAMLSIDNEHDVRVFSDMLLDISVDMSSRVKLVSTQIKNKKNEISSSRAENKKNLNLELNALNEKRKGIIDGLSLLITLMQKHDINTTKLSQLLITSSGTINQQIFDKEVIVGLFVQWKHEFEKWLKLNASSFVVTSIIIVFILIVFRLISLITGRLLGRAIDSSKMKISKLLRDFFVVSVRRFVMLIGALIALSQTGVELGPLLAGLGVLGFVVGFALQGVLSNFASGLMILIYRPYDVGDVVEIAKVKGTVKEMSMVSTTMLSFNNERLVIPNNSIWGSLIRNITSETTRRIDLVFKISFDANLEQVEKIFTQEVAAAPAVLSEPAPTIQLNKQHETYFEYIVRPWVNTGDYWSTYWDLQNSINKRMNAEGVPKLNPYEFLRPLINKV